MKCEQMKREPMKTLSRHVNQIPDKVSRAFADSRDAFRAWLDAAASKLFPIPAPVRIVNRQQYQRPPAAHSPRHHRYTLRLACAQKTQFRWFPSFRDTKRGTNGDLNRRLLSSDNTSAIIRTKESRVPAMNWGLLSAERALDLASWLWNTLLAVWVLLWFGRSEE